MGCLGSIFLKMFSGGFRTCPIDWRSPFFDLTLCSPRNRPPRDRGGQKSTPSKHNFLGSIFFLIDASRWDKFNHANNLWKKFYPEALGAKNLFLGVFYRFFAQKTWKIKKIFSLGPRQFFYSKNYMQFHAGKCPSEKLYAKRTPSKMALNLFYEGSVSLITEAKQLQLGQNCTVLLQIFFLSIRLNSRNTTIVITLRKNKLLELQKLKSSFLRLKKSFLISEALEVCFF